MNTKKEIEELKKRQTELEQKILELMALCMETRRLLYDSLIEGANYAIAKKKLEKLKKS